MFLFHFVFLCLGLVTSIPISSSNLFHYGLDFITPATVSQMQGFKDIGFDLLFIRVYSALKDGTFDTNSITNIRNAFVVGHNVEVFMSPNAAGPKSGSQQFSEVYQTLTLNGLPITSLWVKVDKSSGIWSKKTSDNQLFIEDLYKAAHSFNVSVGFYTSLTDWSSITGNSYVQGLRNDLLWYTDTTGQGSAGETPPNFDNYMKIGGWNAPSVKQFAQTEPINKMFVNKNVYITNSPVLASEKNFSKSFKRIGGNIN